MQQQQTVKRPRLPKRTVAAMVIILLAIPAVIAAGIYLLDDRSYYFISLCIIVLSLLPFALAFEGRRPQARELVVIAALVAIAVAGRAAFFMLPQFKPVVAVVIISGVCLGAEAGFVVGAMTGFVSNFLFGQGPWTPWQMFAFGIIGFLAGVLFKKGWLKKRRLPLCLYGGLATFAIYGVIMDTASLFMMTPVFNWKALLAYMATGLPFNVVHAVATVLFLFVLAPPMMEKLDRIKQKYGMIEP